jgi:hypothetical protein
MPRWMFVAYAAGWSVLALICLLRMLWWPHSHAPWTWIPALIMAVVGNEVTRTLYCQREARGD